ncbi:MAG: hypothetical protein SFY95_04390 [Planctomycetota bacterium]|nr:hypothetical protein [Planctomycetota bacterium]
MTVAPAASTAAIQTPAHTPVWERAKFPGRFPIETMLSEHEVHYLHWVGAQAYRGAGRVVDLGPWLGGSTVALGTGLTSNPRWTGKLLSYDMFVMDEGSARAAKSPRVAGESFLVEYLANTGFLGDRLVARPGRLPEFASLTQQRELYPEQDAIEVLFVDLCKVWGVHNTVLSAFGRHLVPGGLLIQQDFKWDCYWLPIHMWQLRSTFEPVADIPGSATVTFELRGDLASRLEDLWQPQDFAPDEWADVWRDVFAYWRARKATWVLSTLFVQRAIHMLTFGRRDAAFESLEEGARFMETEAGVWECWTYEGLYGLMPYYVQPADQAAARTIHERVRKARQR